MSIVRLREVTEADVPVFFEHQLDPEANRMAAFGAADPTDRAAFLVRWARILADDAVVARTIEFDGRVVGHVARFTQFGEPEVTYWIDRAFWGLGLATAALQAYLASDPVRPLYARAAVDNVGSLRVLDKCGFVAVGEDVGFAEGRGEEVEEFILRLDA
ncbi:RimJ/RimL family protein N-acetyltransferase [Saccharothrix tamanrassetensis]|uniref:RimJ/RimL family protein N-acetyltransferase n=1 Tax=Saccharothrix tamanrassetensis TaxID=1051531 RepID=A0A841C4M2_9PSEU|nr:GNAT family N-acetyltransferase [Saccharothrix tamanrassetensis]MBB5953472.1 RimJ/RimL family protein N-acetyltransferase [Saccharothrix tamanrassetensis]